MGVHGLWKLIESSGKPVPLETLENKVLAVDVSIWLHQAIKGFQDNKGAPIANAHLLGIYHRVCKLLYFKIKPIFVFDGGVPALKRQTIAKRNQYKSKNASEADRLQRQLISTLLKHTAISKVLSEKTKASLPLPKKSTGKYDDLYGPLSAEFDSPISSDEEVTDSSSTTDTSPSKQWDLHTIDTTSHYFKSLPLEVKHEILTDLKDTRKQNSWGKLHQLPKQSGDFSNYQMKRLLKRQEVQTALDNVSKEMGGTSLSLAELESLLNDQGIKTTNDPNFGKRIVSDNNTRYLYIKDIQKEIKEAEEAERVKKNVSDTEEEKELREAIQLSLQETPSTSAVESVVSKTKADFEEEDDLQKAIQLSLGKDPSSINKPKATFSFLESFNNEDFQSESDEDFKEPTPVKKLSSAQNYMLEYSGLTPAEINKIISDNKNVHSSNNRSLKNTKSNELNTESIKQTKFQEHMVQLETEHEGKSQIIEKQTIAEDTVEIMSDSGESDDDFCVVEAPKQSMEIVIDPNKVEADDLFGDIFEAKDTKDDLLSKENVLIKTKPLKHVTFELNHKDNDRNKKKEFVNDTEQKSHIVKEQDSSANNNISAYSVNTKNVAEKVQNKEAQSENVELGEKNESTVDLVSNERSMVPEEPKLTVQEMQEMKDNLLHEKIDILREKSHKERLANNITDQMYQEAQELLELFGVPYIIAPMEAEAQCAFLDEIELTNGTITDDSDVWLFGGRTVYKNFFNQSKYVMEFKSENIEHHFKLNRKQMILLALLVGSDYTIGLQGVGPVTALEILSIFPPKDSQEFTLSNQNFLSGLKEFKSWYLKGKMGGSGRSGLKNKLKNVTFGDHFPNHQVVEAYLDPKIETNRTPFSWSKPDITALTVFAKEKFGWTMKKTEDILNPVMKKLEENTSQTSIKNYFKTQFKVDATAIDGKVSKRVKSAINRIGKSPDELIAEEMEELEKAKDKAGGKKIRQSKKTRNKTDKEGTEANSSESVKEKSVEINNVEKETSSVTSEVEKRKGAKEKKQNSKSVSSGVSKTKTNRKKKEPSKDTKKLALEEVHELKDYENIAMELKMRRKRKNELMKLKIEGPSKKKPKIVPLLPPVLEEIPKELEEDAEIQILTATTSQSNKRVQEIEMETLKALEMSPKSKKATPNTNFHTKDVIHQRLRDKSNLLKNKMKAIEVFRKSKKGPGYMAKSKKTVVLPKEDAELSEESD